MSQFREGEKRGGEWPGSAWGTALLVAGAALLAYWPGLVSYLVSDDFVLLAGAQDPWSTLGTADGRWFRPVGLAFWKLTVGLVAISPPAHHLFSLAVHLLNAFLVWRLGRALLEDGRAGVVAGAVFCLFPTHPEAVTWLSGRFDLLCTLFYLLSLLCLIRHLRNGGAVWIGLSALCALAALLSKEMALSLPLVGLAVIGWKRPELRFRQAVGRILPLVGLMMLALAWRFSTLGSLGGYGFQLEPGWSSLRILWSPLEVFLFPWNRDLLDSNYRVAGLLFPAVTAVHVWALTRARSAAGAAGLALGFLYLSVLPLVNLDRVYPNLQGSRYYYLPAVVFSLWLGACLAGGSPRRRSSLLFYLLCAAALLFAHNLPWREAGRQSHRIVRQLGDLPPGPKALDRVPDHFLGAYVFRNGLDVVDRVLGRDRTEICWRTPEAGVWEGRCEPSAVSYTWSGRRFERRTTLSHSLFGRSTPLASPPFLSLNRTSQ